MKILHAAKTLCKYTNIKIMCLAVQSCSTLCDPMDCSPPGSSVLGESSGKNTAVSCHALLQGIFPTQGSNSGLPNCRRILYQLSHKGSPTKMKFGQNCLEADITQKLKWAHEFKKLTCMVIQLSSILLIATFNRTIFICLVMAFRGFSYPVFLFGQTITMPLVTYCHLFL